MLTNYTYPNQLNISHVKSNQICVHGLFHKSRFKPEYPSRQKNCKWVRIVQKNVANDYILPAKGA